MKMASLIFITDIFFNTVICFLNTIVVEISIFFHAPTTLSIDDVSLLHKYLKQMIISLHYNNV